jgi:hypothetical protein
MDLTHVAQDRDKWWASVNIVMEFHKICEFLDSIRNYDFMTDSAS